VRIGLMFPSNTVFGSQRRLGDGATLPPSLIGSWRDATQHDSLHSGCVGGTKDRSRVVEASNVVEHDNDAMNR